MKIKIFLSSLLAVSLFMVSCKKQLQPQESAPTETAVIDANGNPAPAAQPVNAPAQQQVVQQPMTQQMQQPAQTQATAPGMNPPHGQPNHRCDIAVGAPLNSPPGKNPAAQATPAPVQQQPQIQPQNAAPVVTAPGMNPPHGQPGHKCEVAVGAPLPK